MKKRDYFLIWLLIFSIPAPSVRAGEGIFEDGYEYLPANASPSFGEEITLEDALKRVLATSSEVKRAVERLEKEKALYKGKRAAFFPRFGTEIFEALSTGRKTFLTYFDTTIEQPLFQGGKTLAEKRKQKVIVEQEGLKLNMARLEVELALRTLYVQALAQKELTRIAQGEVKELSQARERVKRLVEKDALPPYEIYRTESLLAQAKDSLVSHKEAYDYADSLLKLALAIKEGEALELAPLREFRELQENVFAYLQAAREKDPLYFLTELRVTEKGYEKRALQAERYPHISLAARFNVARDVFVDTDRFMVGLLGKWNIWDFGRTGSAIRAKEHEMEETRWAGRSEIEAKEREIRELFHKARAARERIRFTEAMLHEREEAYKNDKAKLMVGEKGQAGLLESFLALEETRMQRIKSLTEYRILFERLTRHAGFSVESDFPGDEP